MAEDAPKVEASQNETMSEEQPKIAEKEKIEEVAEEEIKKPVAETEDESKGQDEKDPEQSFKESESPVEIGTGTELTEEEAPQIMGDGTQTNEEEDEEETKSDGDVIQQAVETLGGDDELEYSAFDTSLPGFRSLQDSQFHCESDFTTLVRQMMSDIPLQRLVSTKQLVPSAPRFGPQAMQSLIPRIKKIALDKEIVIRQTLAAQMGGLAEYFVGQTGEIDGLSIVIKDILPCIEKMLSDNVEVRQSASKSLVHIARLLPEDIVHENVLRIVLHLAHDEMDEHKITALPLLGELASVVGPNICASYLASDLHALSQDNSFRVRKATVQVFGAVCSQMGPEKTETQMLDLYQNLATDNIWSVRKGCVESIVDLSKAVEATTRVRLVGIMEKFLKDTSRWVRNTAYEFLGPFIATLTSEQISPEFLRSFTNIPKLKSAEADTESCNHCAFNFPAVVQTVGPERWEELREAYMLLLKKTFKSRKTLACSLHAVAKILGTEIVEADLMQAFELFHKDIDDIREVVLKHFADFLEVMSPAKREDHLATLWEISSEMDANWRFRLLLASQLITIMNLYNADTVSEQIIPLAFQLCDDKMSDVRNEAIKSIPHFMKFMKEKGNEQQYEDTLKRTKNLAQNRTYAKRQLYVQLCGHALGVLDTETYEKELLEPLLNFDHDPVPNVRLLLARLVKNDLLSHEHFAKHPRVLRSSDKLRDDPQDIEVVRFFRTDEEVRDYAKTQKTKKKIETREKVESDTSEDEAPTETIPTPGDDKEVAPTTNTEVLGSVLETASSESESNPAAEKTEGDVNEGEN